MPFNGAGSYTPPAADFPAVANTLIESAKFNNILNDVATALSTCITKDGQTTVTANIPFGGFALTGVASGLAARTRAANIGDVQDGTTQWIAFAGTADALTATYAPALTALIDGQICMGRASAANATTTPTFAPNGLTARTIVRAGGSALQAGDIPAALAEVILRYNLANTRWELLNPALPPLYTPFTTGDVKLTLKTVADTGWVLMDDKTIGNAASSATGRANADTVTLFTLLWTNTADAQCAVSTGRGASAAADYAANKTIALPKALGRALATYGAGSGLTSRVLALATGDETITLDTTMIPSHSHNVPGDSTGVGGSANARNGSVGGGTDIATTSTGGGAAHANMQPTLFLNTMIKL